MGQRALKLCNHPGCAQPVPYGQRYCNKHTSVHVSKNERFSTLTKFQEHRKLVYATTRWTKLSKWFRQQNPLCEVCRKKGLIRPSELVHHEPDVSVLIERGLDPFDEKYLHAICNNCHMSELRKRKK